MHDDEVKTYAFEEVPADDYGVRRFRWRGRQPSIVKQLCARCRTEFQGEGEIKAHQERCVIVGDWVRLTIPFPAANAWIDGELLSMATTQTPRSPNSATA